MVGREGEVREFVRDVGAGSIKAHVWRGILWYPIRHKSKVEAIIISPYTFQTHFEATWNLHCNYHTLQVDANTSHQVYQIYFLSLFKFVLFLSGNSSPCSYSIIIFLIQELGYLRFCFRKILFIKWKMK